ncbi:MAG: beta-ketoacyl synthase N-terminal-like domain-containing protein [Acidobacteriota bacterium]
MTEVFTRPAPPHRRVVVTGVGLLTSAGLGIHQAWDSLRQRAPKPSPWSAPPPAQHVSFPAFQLPEYDLAELGVPGGCLRWLESDGLSGAKDLSHLLGATALALGDADLPVDLSQADDRAAVIVANESPGFEQLTHHLFQFVGDLELPDTPQELFDLLVADFFQLNTFLLPYYVARAFKLEGLSLFVNSACSSGLNAVEIAAQQIRVGDSKIALAAGSDNPLSLAKFMWFHGLGLYALDGVLRPFDPDQTGTVFGDGGATLVLEDYEHARARGARIYAEYLGSGFAQDGWKIAMPNPLKGKARQALDSALESSHLRPAEVDLVVPHGVGAPASDQYEGMVLNQVFSELDELPPVSTFKPLVGHNLGGSALTELAMLMAAFHHQTIPPTLGHRRAFPRNALPVVTEWRESDFDVAVKLTCAFAGFYGASAFRRAA